MQASSIKTLAHYRSLSLLRKRHLITEKDHIHVRINNKSMINFCSNDYLSLAMHPDVICAFKKGAAQYGLGSGASALVSGYLGPHALLEEIFADFLGREKALLFNSGYHANLGVLTALLNRHSTIIADKFCHASMIDGAMLSRAKLERYRHQDILHAKNLLHRAQNRSKQNSLFLMTESVFSILGTLSDVKSLADLAQTYHATLIIDDAHGIGVIGTHGKGISEYAKLSSEKLPCLITPFGKAIGSMGAVVSGSAQMIETLLQFSKTYCYTTALPPAVCLATIATVKLIQQETWRRKKLEYLIQFFIKEAHARKLVLSSTDITPIKSIIVGSNQQVKKIQEDLMQLGLFVSCIRPPTVPKNKACIRISINCMHDEKDICDLLDKLTEYFSCL